MKQGTIADFWDDCKHGVYNFTNKGQCSCCGNCCTAILPVAKQELKNIKRFVKRHHIKPVIHESSTVDFDLTCPFRNEEKRLCNIYDVRPQICRDFKCDKPQKGIQETKDRFSYDNRFFVINIRKYFGDKK